MEDALYFLLEFALANSGKYGHGEFYAQFSREGNYTGPSYDVNHLHSLVTKRGLITSDLDINQWRIIITDRGTQQYNAEKAKRDKLIELADKSEQKLNNEIRIGQRTIKYWWLPIVISAVAVLSAWILHWFDSSQKSQLQEQIRTLDSQLQQTNTKTLHYVDSLYQTGHNTNPSGR